MSSSSPSSAMVAAGVAFTLQLIRLSIDLIVTASMAPDTTTSANSKSSGNDEPSEKRTVTQEGARNGASKAFFEKNTVTYGSVPTSEKDVEGVVPNAALPMTWWERRVPVVSMAVHAILAMYLGVTAFRISQQQDTSMLLESQMLGTSAIAIGLGGVLSWRDYSRRRFGSFQRFLYILTALTLWSGGLLLSTMTMKPLSWTEWAVVSVLTVYFAWSVAESRIVRYPEPEDPSHVEAGTKPVLSRRAVFTLLKPYFWPDATTSSAALNRIRAILTWVCVILSKVCNLFSPMLLGWASTALSRQDYRSCIKYSILYSLIGFFGSTFREGQSLIYLKVAQAAFVQLSEVSFHHLHSLSLDWHLKKKLGEVIRSMDRGIAACDTLMKYLFLWMVPALVECLVVCIIFATYFDYLPMAISVFYFVFIYIVWTILVTLWRKKFRKAVVLSDNEWHDLCTDSLLNFETVKTFTAEDYEMKRFGDAVKRYQSGSVAVQGSLSFLNISQQMILQMCLATSLSMAAIGIKERIDCCVDKGCESGISQCCSDMPDCPGMQVGDFVAVLSYTLQLFAPLNYLGSVYNAVVMAVIDLTHLSELLAESPDVVDAPDAMVLPDTNLVDPNIAVEFDNVVFHYPSQPASSGLKGLSFQMKRGTTTAIVGPTGAGKTTVSRLFFRFYDVLGGAIKVNGVDVRAVTQKSLRGAIGVVPQAASMFNDTLRANILYGRRDATQEELEKAAEDAQLTNFVSSLELGWETMVGDRGLKLSGGEKQRTAIARCLLKDPPYVVLDEATSALDTITENSVQDALDSLGSERTVLVIAHRLGTIRNADNIIVLKEGIVAEQGTHDELLQLNGTYAEMWNMQLHSTARGSQLNLTQLDG